MLIKSILLSTVLLFVLPITLHARDNCWLSPGIKLGYRFGSGGGFVFGMELSMVWEGKDNLAGIVIAFDDCRKSKTTRFNISGETTFLNMPFGVSMGPTVVIHDSQKHLELNTTIYGGLIFIPYLSLTTSFQEYADFELGSYLKIPILFRGPGIRM